MSESNTTKSQENTQEYFNEGELKEILQSLESEERVNHELQQDAQKIPNPRDPGQIASRQFPRPPPRPTPRYDWM